MKSKGDQVMLREGVRGTGRSAHLGRHLLQSKVLILGQLQTYVWGKEGGIGSVSVKPEPSLSASQGSSLSLGNGSRVDQVWLPPEQGWWQKKPYSQLV